MPHLPLHPAGAAGKPVTILRRGASAASLATSTSTATLAGCAAGAAEADSPLVAELMQYGYPPARCAAALQEAGDDVAGALAALFAQLSGGQHAVSGSSST